MKQTEEIKAMIREMMAQEMENFKVAASDGETDKTASPVVYTMLQVLMSKIEAMPKVWHKPGEKPDRTREPILQLYRDMSAGALFYSMLKSEEEVQKMTSHIVAWCYLEDLLPQWIKVVGSDKMSTKKRVLRDDEVKAGVSDATAVGMKLLRKAAERINPVALPSGGVVAPPPPKVGVAQMPTSEMVLDREQVARLNH